MPVSLERKIKMAVKGIRELTASEYKLILENCFANIFVTDGKGDIIFANKNAADSLCVSPEYLYGKNSQDLIDEGIINRSTTLEVLQTKSKAIAPFDNADGDEIMSFSNPVFDEKGKIIMAVTYSRRRTEFDMFVDEIEKERKKTDRYRDAVDYFDITKKNANVIIYKSNAIEELCNTARLIAPTDSTVMLYGESGVGKEVMANYIHNHSDRRTEIFIPINCAAIPEELMESEFFGYVKGAFTGANNNGKAGLFEIADKGTIFLDEIGELPLGMQSKLLRVLESGEFMKIGSEKTQKTDVRVIGATNRDLRNMMRIKKFREDLFYRLNVLPLDIPPLRERKEDILELANFFLEKANRKYGKKAVINELNMRELYNYSWPGNVRELRNILERYVITGSEAVIKNLKIEEEKPDNYVIEENIGVHSSIEDITDEIIPLKEKLNAYEQKYIRDVLNATGNNVQEAADRLGVHKSSIYRKINVR